VPFGQARLVREGRDAVILCWGESVYRAREAAEALAAEGHQTAILDLRTIVPWDEEAVFAAVRRTGKVLIVHEDTRTCGFGAELAARISEEVFEYLDAPIRRLATADVPSPCHDTLFDAVMPTTAKVQAALAELLRY
jgi:2-oxoisovalerate dehydrogenase E1 component